jgi:hypothetical protein
VSRLTDYVARIRPRRPHACAISCVCLGMAVWATAPRRCLYQDVGAICACPYVMPRRRGVRARGGPLVAGGVVGSAHTTYSRSEGLRLVRRGRGRWTSGRWGCACTGCSAASRPSTTSLARPSSRRCFTPPSSLTLNSARPSSRRCFTPPSSLTLNSARPSSRRCFTPPSSSLSPFLSIVPGPLQEGALHLPPSLPPSLPL